MANPNGRPRKNDLERTDAPPRQKERIAYDAWLRGTNTYDIAKLSGPDGKPLYASAEGARQAVNRAAAYLAPSHDLQELRAQSLAGLQETKAELWKIIRRRHVLRDARGKAVTAPVRLADGSLTYEAVEDDMPRIQALRVLERVDARIGTLMGLDAPTKYQHSGVDGGPIELNVRVSALMARTEDINLLPRERVEELRRGAIDTDAREA